MYVYAARKKDCYYKNELAFLNLSELSYKTFN